MAEYRAIAEAVADDTLALFCTGNSDPRDPFSCGLAVRVPWEQATPGQSLLDETAASALAIHLLHGLLHGDARTTTYYRTIV